ncbi:Uma2 family endonuclease [Streptomyces sp. NBC_01387]|uniref:Uma2 family endonuclease n=1 Tax=unclassified Streptomyces TaxID=2593676 RepID=UPI002023DD8D|nr:MULTISPECIES: Uma2 family endonuclease [unclassified Streptomyces]MCX4550450.1 Uma2 family endonuclease [Streptomyces sp. NBC_01500]WSC21904.1 Uma2 family endonuclease [Streptomyces sp. NBC_01766]WSV55858.1 Uma2 family endonuclease [Streptomyces sp. NBC_01014]
MTALAHEVSPAVDEYPVSDLDEVLWQAWKAMDLPEGYRAEIIEGSIEVSPTGRRRHGVLIGRIRRALDAHLAGGDHGDVVHHDINVIHHRKSWIPDLFVAPLDLDQIPDEEGLGVDAAGVSMVIEVVSPGHRNEQRDRVRKRREYARAGISLYVLVDDHDGDGTVVVLASPNSEKANYADEHRVPYGTDAVIQEGPAKGFVIGADITRS